MADVRIQKMIAVVGKKGVGKTFKTTADLFRYLIPNPEKGIPGRRSLIFDVNNEFENVKTLPLEYIKAFSVHPSLEVRRIVPFKNNGEKMTTNDLQDALDYILKNYYGGTLLLEDIRKYATDNLKKDLVGAICTNRHNNVDMILHYQSPSLIQSKIWENLSVIRFHKCTSKVSSEKSKYGEKFEILAITESIVNKKCETNPRHFTYIDIEEEKIKENPNDPDVDFAINEYISKNPKETVNLHSYSLDQNYKKISMQQAFAEAKKEIIKKYF